MGPLLTVHCFGLRFRIPAATLLAMIVAVTGAFPVLTPVNDPMFPAPLDANPIEVLLLVQLNTVPATAPVKLIAVVAPELHIV